MVNLLSRAIEGGRYLGKSVGLLMAGGFEERGITVLDRVRSRLAFGFNHDYRLSYLSSGRMSPRDRES